MPALLLSGTLTPIHAMPTWLQPITWVNPLRFYLEGSRAILLKGARMEDLWHQAAILMGFGVVILASASLRFRKTVA